MDAKRGSSVVSAFASPLFEDAPREYCVAMPGLHQVIKIASLQFRIGSDQVAVHAHARAEVKQGRRARLVNFAEQVGAVLEQQQNVGIVRDDS